MRTIFRPALRNACSKSVRRYLNTVRESNGVLSPLSMDNVRPIRALYFHWPYCSKICPYCDFNKYRWPQHHSQQRRVDEEHRRAFLTSIDEHKAANVIADAPTSIYFGGGTPSLASVETIADIINSLTANSNYESSQNAEITVECHPSDFDTEKMKDLVDVGVNRFSIGVQSLDAKELSFLRRSHSTADISTMLEKGIPEVIALAKQKSVDSQKGQKSQRLQNSEVEFSMDFMVGLPGQKVEELERRWHDFLSLYHPLLSHLSLYTLTIEPQTPFSTAYLRGLTDRKTGWRYRELEAEKVVEMVRMTRDVWEDYGFERYEVSNYAKRRASSSASPSLSPTASLSAWRESLHLSTHNWNYWSSGDYVGLGPGAHGRWISVSPIDGTFTRIATTQWRHPTKWTNPPPSSLSPSLSPHYDSIQSLSPPEHFAEILLQNLRLLKIGLTPQNMEKSGWNFAAKSRKFSGWTEFWPKSVLDELEDLDMIQVNHTVGEERMVATEKGSYVLDAVVERLFSEWKG